MNRIWENWNEKNKRIEKWLQLIHKFFYTLDSSLLPRIKKELNLLLYESGNQKKKIIQTFMKELPLLIDIINEDVKAAYFGDPACVDIEEAFFMYPGFYAILVHRVAHILHQVKARYLPRMLSEYAHAKTGIDIHPGATIQKGFFIDHGTGVVIGETTDIGEGVRLYQGVTLGALSLKDGRNEEKKKRHPTIGNHVILYANCAVLGGQTKIEDYRIVGIQEIIKK